MSEHSSTSNAKTATSSPRLTATTTLDICPDWEYIYLYRTEALGQYFKLCKSSQSQNRFIEKTSKFYKDPIELMASGIHPCANSGKLDLAIKSQSIGNGFYTSDVVDKLEEYLKTVLGAPELLELSLQLFDRFNALCEPSQDSSLHIVTVLDRITPKQAGKSISHLLCSKLFNALVPVQDGYVAYKWKHCALSIYNSFIDHYIHKNSTDLTIRLADVLIALRKWFVCEERFNGHKIPHKSARRSTIVRILTDRYGEPTRAKGTGAKDSEWQKSK